MPRLVQAARASDLPPGARLALDLDGRAVALFNVGGRLFAIEDRCPHQLAPLHDGAVCGTRVTCAWHGWTFEMDPAKPAAAALPRIERYPVKVEGDQVFVELP